MKSLLSAGGHCRSCVQVRNQFAFQLGNHVFELQLAPLEPLDAQSIMMQAINQMTNCDVEVAVLDLQFIYPGL